MKALVFCLLISTIVFAQDSIEYKGNQIEINGLKVSGQQSFVLEVNPEFLFCIFKGHNGVYSSETLRQKVARQEMIFFQGSLIGTETLVIRKKSEIMTHISCTDKVRNGISRDVIENIRTALHSDLEIIKRATLEQENRENITEAEQIQEETNHVKVRSK